MQAQITITVSNPIECTPEQFREWLEFHYGKSSAISIENPNEKAHEVLKPENIEIEIV